MKTKTKRSLSVCTLVVFFLFSKNSREFARGCDSPHYFYSCFCSLIGSRAAQLAPAIAVNCGPCRRNTCERIATFF